MSDVKRILHVIPGLGHGGAEHQLMLNAVGLDRARFESHVCHLRPSTALVPAMRGSGVPVHMVTTGGLLKCCVREGHHNPSVHKLTGMSLHL